MHFTDSLRGLSLVLGAAGLISMLPVPALVQPRSRRSRRHRLGEHWVAPEIIERNRPHVNADSFDTPTLVIHGEKDYRVPLNHGIELFNTLQNRGVPSRFIYYPDENHWILKRQNSIH